jgi:hypothetical protein
MVYPPVFYQTARSPAEATVITLSSGEERSAVDLEVAPAATARIAGTLIGPDGPIGGARVQLHPKGFDGAAAGEDDPVTATDSDGRYVFPAVPHGDYILSGRQQSFNPSRALWFSTTMSVAGDMNGVVGVMRPGLRVAGRMEYQGAAPPPRLPQMTFQPVPFFLDAVDGAGINPMTSARFGALGFTLEGFASGTYLIRVPRSPQGWMFKSAVINGVDVSETPFDLTSDITDLVITFTDRWSGLGGTVHDGTGNPDPNATVVVFPTNVDAWHNYGSTPRRLKSGATDANGQFGIGSLPPGDYYVVAIPDDESDEWRDPKTLDVLARIATTVTILEGEHRMIELRTKDMPR